MLKLISFRLNLIHSAAAANQEAEDSLKLIIRLRILEVLRELDRTRFCIERQRHIRRLPALNTGRLTMFGAIANRGLVINRKPRAGCTRRGYRRIIAVVTLSIYGGNCDDSPSHASCHIGFIG